MGKRIALSNGRTLVSDLVQVAAKFPFASVYGDFDAGEVAKIRRRARPRISWNVLYMKAYSKVALEFPELRQCYMGFPWPYIYEHQRNVCMLTLSREYAGEERLLFARFNNPESETLADLQVRYDFLRHAPIEKIKQFRHQINFAKLPYLVRRFAWWVMMNLWPETRCGQVGTFGMSTSGYRGVFGNQILGPLTTLLGVEPIPRKGVGRIVLTFDHRVVDGVPVSEIIQRMHVILTTEIREELIEMSSAEENRDHSNEHDQTVQPREGQQKRSA